jgi:sec-independent protein translocase protein TatA
MGIMSWGHWVVVAAIALLLFGGRGKLSGLMREVGKGVRGFRDELKNGKAALDIESQSSDRSSVEIRPSDLSDRARARTDFHP